MSTARIQAALVLGVVVVAFGVGVYFGISERMTAHVSADTTTTVVDPSMMQVTGTPDRAGNVDMTQFWRVYNYLNSKFVVTHASSSFPSEEEQIYGAIEGLTNSFGDPYTVFMPPSEAQVFNDDIKGSFSGVGMELAIKNGLLTVVAPLKDSPSERAGMRSGDTVVAIDGVSTDGFAVDQAVKKIRGEKGTPVVLTVKRDGEPAPLTISIIRDTINIPVLKSYKRSDGVYIIELYSFSANSSELFRDALRKYFESGATKMILDLRGNPGGYLEAAVDMASYFLPVGATVVTEDYRGKQANLVHRSVGYNVFVNKSLSMVVLTDQGSASASEILAGALQQHGIAKLVGTRTFGKGSVQELLDLGGGAQVKITVARWLTPNGTSISDGGLQPDTKVDRTAEDRKAGRDPQMDSAVQYLFSH